MIIEPGQTLSFEFPIRRLVLSTWNTLTKIVWASAIHSPPFPSAAAQRRTRATKSRFRMAGVDRDMPGSFYNALPEVISIPVFAPTTN
jgi:hypothetical protein